MFKKLSLILIGVVICSLALSVSGVALAQEDAPPRPEAKGRHHGGGEVTAIGTDNFTVQGPRGGEHIVYVDENTEFTDRDGTAHSYSDVKVGSHVFVQAELRSDGKWWATRVGFPPANATNPPLRPGGRGGPGGPGPRGPHGPPPDQPEQTP